MHARRHRATLPVIGLLQRVSSAQVSVDGNVIAAIGRGLLVFVGIEARDAPAQAERLLERLLTYRVFADAAGRMNLSLRDVGGGLLLVPQFTLAADTARGTRPGFSTAAPPEAGRALYAHLLRQAKMAHPEVESGEFAADMQVTLTNDGPVTFWLRVAPASGGDGA